MITLKELYELCDNLGPHTIFTIMEGPLEKTVETDYYINLKPKYYEATVKGFKIRDLRVCWVYI